MIFRTHVNRSSLSKFVSIMVLIYHGTVRSIRSNHTNPVIGLLLNMMMSVIFVGAFFLMFSIMGVRGAQIAGADFLIYMMSGIFLFMTHTKSVSAVMGADGPTSPMMQHAPMNTMIAVAAAALSSLYLQVLSAAVILFVYHVGFTPFDIMDPVGAVGMLLLAWASGCSVGMMMLAAKPWAPSLISLVSTVYQRANMIASGKMFVANALPPSMLVMFDWNPLFHCIDQARGYTFVNYFPNNSSISYPIYFSLVCVMLGLMGEFYTRKKASLSWAAGH